MQCLHNNSSKEQDRHLTFLAKQAVLGFTAEAEQAGKWGKKAALLVSQDGRQWQQAA
jgi:hypothetical protein